ncbi:MAG: gamma-glutamyl-gamma-aminobutyrate hydrolase family protein [Bacteroidetes bacterium]|nr:gamma-glutamyl-gamma-aminobutyrate hydrolase family protein [Bacteroidota bacterium]
MRSRKFWHIYFICSVCLIFLFMLSCGTKESKPRIALSKSSPNYIQWLKRANPDIQIINLYSLNKNVAVEVLENCDGLLLTGGEDVFPGWYGKEAEASRCTGLNLRRDSLEMAVVNKAMEMRMPVFGICRGHQLLNVYLGGKLIIDLPTDYGQSVTHMCRDYLHCQHEVYIQRNSTLYQLTEIDSASVTTNHHEAVDFLSPLLTVSARSADGLIEGIEWLNPEGKNFLMGVQWHPERMDKSNPLSGLLAEKFIKECELYLKSRTHL